MYARVAIATGWTWEYIGQCLTLPRLYAMLDYWKRFPPVHEVLAGFAGIKPPDDVRPIVKTDNVWSLVREMDDATAESLEHVPMIQPRMPARGG